MRRRKSKPAVNRKHLEGDKVWYATEATTPEGVVVSVRQYGIVAGMVERGSQGKKEYLVLRTWDKGHNYVYGGTVRKGGWELHKDTDSYWSRNATKPRVYRANQRIGTMHERGCVCNCCVHVPAKPSDVRHDGTFKWEEQE